MKTTNEKQETAVRPSANAILFDPRMDKGDINFPKGDLRDSVSWAIERLDEIIERAEEAN